MPYKLKGGTDPANIAEQEYATSSTIGFTTFTSCIGVIAKKGSELTGIHLVMVADDHSTFDEQAATAVHQALPDTYDKVSIVGCINLWENPDNGVRAAFQKLSGGIKSLEKVQVYDRDFGIYGATIEGSDIKVTFRKP
jgi:hypothetical protein